jgi:hypothetical protein
MGGLYQIMPELTKTEYEDLKNDIKKHGIHMPVMVDEQGNVLDGYHRQKIAEELRLNYRTEVVSGLDEQEKRSFARRVNLHRRQLNRKQRRRIIAAELLENSKRSNNLIAKAIGVHHSTVATVREELVHGCQISNHTERIGADGVTQPVPIKEETLPVLTSIEEAKRLTRKLLVFWSAFCNEARAWHCTDRQNAEEEQKWLVRNIHIVAMEFTKLAQEIEE